MFKMRTPYSATLAARMLTKLHRGWPVGASADIRGLTYLDDKCALGEIYTPNPSGRDMATSKTSSFWLTDVVTLPVNNPSGTVQQATIDLGAYVDVGDQQALSVESVDWIFQRGTANSGDFQGMLIGDGAFNCQLSDLNPGANILRADDNTLVASATLNIDQDDNIGSFHSDMYPDVYGKLDEARSVVNDQLYVNVMNSGSDVGATHVVNVTVRIKARIVKLNTKDWMAIAIQSTAADN